MYIKIWYFFNFHSGITFKTIKRIYSKSFPYFKLIKSKIGIFRDIFSHEFHDVFKFWFNISRIDSKAPNHFEMFRGNVNN